MFCLLLASTQPAPLLPPPVATADPFAQTLRNQRLRWRPHRRRASPPDPSRSGGGDLRAGGSLHLSCPQETIRSVSGSRFKPYRSIIMASRAGSHPSEQCATVHIVHAIVRRPDGPMTNLPLILAYITAFVGTAIAAALAIRHRESTLETTGIYRVVMATCLAVGTVSHGADVLRAGWLPAPHLPLGVNLYWTSLTFFDPLAAVLLVVAPRAGLLLTVAIMVSDVAINTSVLGVGWPLAFQAGFALFVAAVVRPCWLSVSAADVSADGSGGADIS